MDDERKDGPVPLTDDASKTERHNSGTAPVNSTSSSTGDKVLNAPEEPDPKLSKPLEVQNLQEKEELSTDNKATANSMNDVAVTSRGNDADDSHLKPNMKLGQELSDGGIFHDTSTRRNSDGGPIEASEDDDMPGSLEVATPPDLPQFVRMYKIDACRSIRTTQTQHLVT